MAKVEITRTTRSGPSDSAARKFALSAMRHIPALREETVEIDFTGEARMRQLNSQFRGKDKTTDVLSFTMREPGDGGPGPCGAIAICPLYSEARAREAGITPRAMYEELILHGLLHITGSDHETDAQHRAMQRRKNTVLAKLAAEKKSVK